MLTVEEFNQRYVSTYVRWRRAKDSGFVPAHINQAHGSGFQGVVDIESGGHSEVLPYPRCLDVLDLESPEAGYFSNNGHALYLFKYPERQWRRGLCNANAEIYNPFSRLFVGGVYQCGFGMKAIQAIFSGGHVQDIGHAIGMLSSEVFSVPISRSIMVSHAPVNSKSPVLLWYGLSPVSMLENGRFRVEDPIFEQEVHDEFRNLGQLKWMNF